MSAPKILVVTHSADYDGVFSREIARRFFGNNAEYIGWDFPDKRLEFPDDAENVFIIDLPPTCFEGFERFGLEESQKIIWIDHHKSAIDKWQNTLYGYRIDGVAACRLAWQWFFSEEGPMNPRRREPDYRLPTKEEFINRQVNEPLAVRLAGEYDVWDHRDNDADVAFQFGLDTRVDLRWDLLLNLEVQDYVKQLVSDGRLAMQSYAKRDADIMRGRSFKTTFEGLTFLCLNTARCNSNTFAALDVPETGHDALMAFYTDGRLWSVSMYHAAHNRDIDLSAIAAKYGGGGHRGACGFRCNSIPFPH